jgi:peptidoglycan/LPS O-acetylase OafA/YrhL
VDPLAGTAMPVHLGEFALGMLVAAIMRTGQSYSRPLVAIIMAISGIVGLTSHFGKGGHVVSGLHYTAFGLCFACVMLLLSNYDGAAIDKNPVTRTLCGLGLISYSVYVVHFPVMLILQHYNHVFGSTPMLELAAFTVIGLPAVIAVALGMFYGVERFSIPSLRLNK